ncbi:golgin candidate 5 [Rhodamnia argentea]|uniref:Golgin candidate 5 n=1 Tax=Rhodamnia argentea TaxID=178133 RepID=A0A8B8NS50_9MYRT|nr:golgin candidate 5 [Rhodamnia argentea]XP_030525335.1 golgin candidate 5 [Rhodamnia argentea]
MAWFSGRVSLGNFPDLAGAVNKLSESVKNIEKNFDSALGFEEKSESSNEGPSASGMWPSATDRKALFEPVISFMGQRSEDDASVESSKQSGSPEHPSKAEEEETAEINESQDRHTENTVLAEDVNEELKLKKHDVHSETMDETEKATSDPEEVVSVSAPLHDELHNAENSETSKLVDNVEQKESLETNISGSSVTAEAVLENPKADQAEGSPVADESSVESSVAVDLHEIVGTDKTRAEDIRDKIPLDQSGTTDTPAKGGPELSGSPIVSADEVGSPGEFSRDHSLNVLASEDSSQMLSHDEDKMVPMAATTPEEPSGVDDSVEVIRQLSNAHAPETDVQEQRLSSVSNVSGTIDAAEELETVKREMKMMETALQGAARQAQAKADEIAKLMNENEQLKALIEDLKRKSNDAEIETLREEYHQRVAALERKVYSLTRERDTLRREQSRKSDAAALLKEKDEIINQVMAEGEELSKKQAAQESTIRKLRAQIREFEEEKKGLTTKLQVEENKAESMKRDKAATEKLLQETIEKHQAELSAQKEFYTSALNAAKEAEALAEARANSEARTELESRLREAEEREAMLVQTLDELRQTLSRKEQQSVFREDMLRRDIEDLQKRYQESERRCEELISQVPESTRPLLRQIEAIQEAASRKAEAWAAVERSLNSRLQEEEAKAAAAEERARSVNERLSQTLSRINVLEAQISCLRAEQTQQSRSLEKERQRAAENRQEYLAAKEEADTLEGRVTQLEEETRELKRKHKQELQEALMHRELLQQELEREKTARLELERTSRMPPSAVSDPKTKPGLDNGILTRKLSSTSSLGSMEESYFLQASLDSSDGMSERRNAGETGMSPYYMKSMTPRAFEATLRQKEGELASYMSRLASMESIRDSLAEELVNLTAQCEKLRSEAATVPGIRAELEALRRRHSAALELMGERDEELEELRADIVDLKEMYREQVNLLVNQIQKLGSTMRAA